MSVERGLYWEELRVGAEYSVPGPTIAADAIVRFAEQWDPQPFHLDAAAAASSVFGSLVASGLHSLLLTYRLYLETRLLRGTALAGLGIDEIRFPKPLKPGDTLDVRVRVHDKRETRRPDRGIVTLELRGETDGTPCVTLRLSALIARQKRLVPSNSVIQRGHTEE